MLIGNHSVYKTPLHCKFRSGTEKDYTERDHLLQQVVDLMRESGHKIKKPMKRIRKPFRTLQMTEYEPGDLHPSQTRFVAAAGSQSAHSQRVDAVAYRDSQSMGLEDDVPEEQEGEVLINKVRIRCLR